MLPSVVNKISNSRAFTMFSAFCNKVPSFFFFVTRCLLFVVAVVVVVVVVLAIIIIIIIISIIAISSRGCQGSSCCS